MPFNSIPQGFREVEINDSGCEIDLADDFEQWLTALPEARPIFGRKPTPYDYNHQMARLASRETRASAQDRACGYLRDGTPIALDFSN